MGQGKAFLVLILFLYLWFAVRPGVSPFCWTHIKSVQGHGVSLMVTNTLVRVNSGLLFFWYDKLWMGALPERREQDCVEVPASVGHTRKKGMRTKGGRNGVPKAKLICLML